jgi:hypothetical protein
MKVFVRGFVKRDEAHQRISLLQCVALDTFAGGLGVPSKDSGNDVIVI